MAGQSTFMSVKLEGIDKLKGTLEALRKRFPSVSAQTMRMSAKHVLIPAIRAIIDKKGMRFTGEYKGRMDAKSGVTSGEPWVEVGAIGVPYGLNIEKGAPPHTPNPKRIAEYVQKKMGYQGDQADAVTAAIIQTIETAGTKPHPVIIPAWHANSGRFFSDFVARMRAKGLKAAAKGGTP